ncbi:hypothetical protein SEPL_299 [Salmonella phage SE_PL]|uniref:hypothetical protein n=1 Tax=Salmonella enterica TaxID=28901 RepID=UPI000FDFA299|nr:hypothetical protein CPT_Munch_126 [Salmonella phage Munch]EAZ2022919.1 hypothetical protein [Salmonella enterica]ECV9084053.1 hypothetical protein [Salmonella enterica subsp. enterica serovar Infantis]MCP0435845.1 hypothetical protein [Salmonella enterica subsp. enterica serovar Mbandaka]QCW18805.1 hypothetical protein 7t3_0284 [Salmonella phage 7t3]QIG62912.1 hypothetical protein SEPL_299 [Salmonella phage SE_PL]WNV47233.1 hypothetical protein [Klebsiella phage fENko-Kae01]
MDKLLVRGVNAPQDAEVVSTEEFITLAFDQISAISLDLSFSKESGEVLEGMSDMLELMKAILIAKNINPINLFVTAEKLRSEEGTFSDKKAVQQEQE